MRNCPESVLRKHHQVWRTTPEAPTTRTEWSEPWPTFPPLQNVVTWLL